MNRRRRRRQKAVETGSSDRENTRRVLVVGEHVDYMFPQHITLQRGRNRADLSGRCARSWQYASDVDFLDLESRPAADPGVSLLCFRNVRIEVVDVVLSRRERAR